MSWTEFFIPLDPSDPPNADRLDPEGERIRVRIRKEAGAIVDFVVQYETPVAWGVRSHAEVIRSDGTHEPHYDLYDRFGNATTVLLPHHWTMQDTIANTLADIERSWPEMKRRYLRGLR